ncbi:hypothetical protein BC332_14234 [Capsicum chinense]|nr:hypothetical protein BC332_14234 [Capsicum chinense]
MESTIDSAGATYVIAYVYIGAAGAIAYIYIGTAYAIAYVYIGAAYTIAYAFQWSYLTSSTPSNSSVSVLPPKISPLSISKTSKYLDVNFASQNSSQSAPAPSKKFPLSIAERRGSLSKCLKLPMLTDDFERKGGHLKSVANEQGVDNPSDKEVTVFGGFHESWEKKSCNESSSAVLNGVVDTSGASCNLVKPVVYRWPSLEILATCSIDDLDSKGAYIFIIPTSGLGKDASRAVYVWVGRSFSCDFSKVRQVDCKGPGDPGEIDWKQAASVVLHQMVLPIDSNIKVKLDCTIQIERFAMLLEFLVETACYMRGKAEDANVVKENEEPAELLALLSSRRLLLEVVRGGSPECTCYSAATPDDRLRGNSLTRLFVVHFP